MDAPIKAKNQLQSADIVGDVLNLYTDMLVPFMRIRRDLPFPTEPERNETDGEHSFGLAMVAISIAERLDLGLDTGMIAKYALIHDLVEVHAGDVSARASEDFHQVKPDKEHEAYLAIKSSYEQRMPWVPALIEQYEQRLDAESRFVYAADKLMGAITIMAGDGARWDEFFTEADGSDYHAVVDRLRSKAASFPELLPIFDLVHDRLDQQRHGYIRGK